jgi:hypothetical protein
VNPREAYLLGRRIGAAVEKLNGRSDEQCELLSSVEQALVAGTAANWLAVELELRAHNAAVTR